MLQCFLRRLSDALIRWISSTSPHSHQRYMPAGRSGKRRKKQRGENAAHTEADIKAKVKSGRRDKKNNEITF